jgi:hypothetical protein
LFPAASLALLSLLAASLDAPAAGHKSGARPIVFWLAPGPSSCAWKLYDPALQQARTLAETPTCPRRILWDRRGRRAFFERDARIWELAWDRLAEPRDVAPARMPITLPEGAEAESVQDFAWWISRATGRLRTGLSLPLGGDNSWGQDAPQSVEYEGKTYPMAPLPFVVRHPVFGAQITAIALVWELAAEARWERIAAKGTRIGFPTMDYCDDVDCGKHDIVRERTRYSDGLYAVASKRDPHPDAIDTAAAAVAADCDVSGRCKPKDLNLGEDTRVLLDLQTASDHVCVGERVVLCRVPPKLKERACAEEDCAEAVELVPGSVKWSPALQRYRGYGLLVDSQTASRPLLVAAGRLAAVWAAPNGKLAGWLPWPELWPLAKP